MFKTISKYWVRFDAFLELMYVKPISKIMPAIKYINRLLAIDQMIKLRLTGSPKQLAEKLELSERQVYTYLNVFARGGRKARVVHILKLDM